MGFADRKYTDLRPPAMGSQVKKAHSATAARYEAPLDWYGEMVTVISWGSNLTFAPGDGGVMVGATIESQVLSETIVPDFGSGMDIPAGSMTSMRWDPDCTHFSVDSDGTTGYWEAFRSSGPLRLYGEELPEELGKPGLWLDIARYPLLTVSSGVAAARGVLGSRFAEATNKPAYTNGAASAVVRPSAAFTAASSHKLVATDAALCALFGSTAAFTLFISGSRGATGAAHTLFSVGTDGSNNGRWDLAINASDDIVATRVSSAGASDAATVTTNVSAAQHMWTYTRAADGVATIHQDRTSQTVVGTNGGDVGTVTKVSIGCRGYNTSTFDNFMTGEIAEVLAWSGVLDADKLASLHAWAKRRYGV